MGAHHHIHVHISLYSLHIRVDGAADSVLLPAYQVINASYWYISIFSILFFYNPMRLVLACFKIKCSFTTFHGLIPWPYPLEDGISLPTPPPDSELYLSLCGHFGSFHFLFQFILDLADFFLETFHFFLSHLCPLPLLWKGWAGECMSNRLYTQRKI